MNTATYSPEDNKLRLYVGRVPRDEYEKLRADGWVSTPKQDCDFVATWTPSRRDTCLEYADMIEDEDQSPAERAADRAERFSGYRDNRTDDALGHADRYDAGPSAHGYQSAARAERSAARHDRIAGRACDMWSKAEYWQRRTAGVISHALYKSTPGVRMGRIKTLEAELRKLTASFQESKKRWEAWRDLAAMTDTEKQNQLARLAADYVHGSFVHPVTGAEMSLYRIAEDQAITGAQIAALYLAKYKEPQAPEDSEWVKHLNLRLAYENQMLEAQGGRLEQCEVLPGGKFGGKLILKVSKSSVTGRATSVKVLGPKVSGWHYQVSNIPHTEFAEYHFDLERFSPDAYTPPTPESLAELAALKKQFKAAAPVKAPCPLINPTDADAERLQAMINERSKAELDEYDAKKFEPKPVLRIPQSVYSANSKGAYAKAETRGICRNGEIENRQWNMYSPARDARAKRIGPKVCEVRLANYDKQVIILTDKPQKPFPAQVWEAPTPEPASVTNATGDWQAKHAANVERAKEYTANA